VDVEAWKEAAIGSLDDDYMVNGAQVLVVHGEKMLERYQELKTNQSVARILQHLESEDIEKSVLSKLHSLNAQELFSSAERGLTSAEAREELVSHFKDICLDFILKILPAIHIDKIAGNDNGCDWEINDINFSDFGFRKENVHISLGDPNKPNEDLLRVTAWDISAHFRNLKVTVKQTGIPYLKAVGIGDAKVERMSVALAFKLLPSGEVAVSGGAPSTWAGGGDTAGRSTGRSMTSAQAAGGGSSASSTNSSPAPGTMMVTMSSRSILMDSLELTVGETSYSMIVNALTFLFADVLKNYACEKIAERLDEHMGFLIEGLNTVLVACTPYLEKLGFQLPAMASGAGQDSVSAKDFATRAILGHPQASGCEDAWVSAVPRLNGWGSGRPDGFPEELDFADPGRSFAVRT